MFTEEIRRDFLRFFKQKGHSIISSSSVVPHEDPTLLFTNAGMNQFKDVFLGASFRDYKRAATSQKCIRVGGKHNDLDNVGHTSRHLTFFEMLGNFSFGDYFKKEAIQFAWEVSTEVFQFEPDRIWPTVFQGDEEAYELWKAYVPAQRITRFGEKDNFWAMGDTGPCGPCSELLYDRGEAFGNFQKPSEDLEGERFLEFWNLVFMQFNRGADGKMTPLPSPSIDTGAGIERVVSLRMGVKSVFETDILGALIGKIEEVSAVSYNPEDEAKAPAFRVIADHLRSLTFAIADGAQPSNVDRGYVLRKILRRAVRYGKQIGFEKPFLAKILPTLVDLMGNAYPELTKAKERISEILTGEEEAFFRTLKRGGNLLAQIVDNAKAHRGEISGEDAFKLKDTYGLPYEEIVLLAKDGGFTVDEKQFRILEEAARERSRSVHKTSDQMASESAFEPYFKKNGPTHFLGHETVKSISSIKGIVKEGQFSEELKAGEEGLILLDKSPFYAEMGGQVGDRGVLKTSQALFTVIDCQAPFKGLIGHLGKMKEGNLRVGMVVEAAVDEKRREKIANNHTATHLLHLALQKVLGEHIKQAGSVVDAERLRFDFNHHKALTREEIRSIEDWVNSEIRANHTIETYELPYEEIKDRQDIKQFFGEKYGSRVRVVETGSSKELCGGTHASTTGVIGYFRISRESSIAAGVRRIEALSGKEAEDFARLAEDEIYKLSNALKIAPAKFGERVEKLLEENRSLSDSLKKMREKELQTLKNKLLLECEEIRGIKCIAEEVSLNPEEMRKLAEELISEVPMGLVLLGAANEGKAYLFLRLGDQLVKKGMDATGIIRDLAPLIEGSGGGKAQNATAGGKAPEKIPLALLKVRNYIP